MGRLLLALCLASASIQRQRGATAGGETDIGYRAPVRERTVGGRVLGMSSRAPTRRCAYVHDQQRRRATMLEVAADGLVATGKLRAEQRPEERASGTMIDGIDKRVRQGSRGPARAAARRRAGRASSRPAMIGRPETSSVCP